MTDLAALWARIAVRRRGMILRGMVDTYEQAQHARRRKGAWLVLYIRARQSNDRLRGYFRRQHFADKEQADG